MNENEINQTELQPETAAPAPVKKRSASELAFAIVAVVMILAIVVALVFVGADGSAQEPTESPTLSTSQATIPADGNHDDETCKGSYTVTDEQAIADANKVVATMGEQTLTNADLQIYYWMQVVSFLNDFSNYLPYVGLDITQPLDTQACTMMDGVTWQQYFLGCALEAWNAYEALAQEAIAAGFDAQSEDYQIYAANLREQVLESAKQYGFASIEEQLAAIVGPGSNEAAYLDYMQTYYLGYLYFNALMDQRMPTAEEVEAYFDSNAEAYAENGIEKDDSIYVDVRHILIMPQGGTKDDSGNTTYSDAEWEAARVEAQGILDQWLAGDATEEAFGELAKKYTFDSNGEAGGLYTYVAEGDMVPEFNDWCFDPARQVGDYGLVKTQFGYHVMYFSGSHSVWYTNAENDLANEISSGIVPEIMENYEITADYTNMVIGYVNLAR